jgi:mannose-6-phosphate isomerase-like protein (cupin superfamily)
MAQLKIVKADEVQPQNIRGFGKAAGQVRRLIATEKLFFDVDDVSPGFSPHHRHTHGKYRADGVEAEYPADFDEIYFILRGGGVMQWKTESGEVREQEVRPGDTIHMPPGVLEHQRLNNGPEKIRLAAIGVAPPRRTPI